MRSVLTLTVLVLNAKILHCLIDQHKKLKFSRFLINSCTVSHFA